MSEDTHLIAGYDGLEYEHQIGLWHEQNYGSVKVDVPATYRKLLKEVGELGEALMRHDNANIEEEAADVGILLTHLLRSCCGRSLPKAIQVKMEAVEARTHNKSIPF